MTEAQLEQLMKDIAEVTKEYVAKQIATRDARIKALEERPVLKYMGVWAEEQQYNAGNLVTRAGSIFHANRSTRAKPGEGSADWTLAVKRGADGKDAR